MTRWRWVWLALVFSFSLSPQREEARCDEVPAIKRVPGRLPFSFEPNVGQAPPDVAFVAHRGGAVFLFSSTGVRAASASGSLELKLLGAASVPGEGEKKLPGVANYFLGEAPERWRTHVPTWAQVVFRNVYPFVDLVWHSERGELEFDFVLHPGADLSQVRLASAAGVAAPVFFQGDRRLEGRAVAMDDGALAFEVDYDRSAPLVIDPVLAWSTYLGGSADDYSYAIAVDAAGSALVTGATLSPNFPTQSPLQAAHGGGLIDAFVAKLSAR